MARFHVSTGHLSVMPKACNYLFLVKYYKFIRERRRKQSEIVCILTSLTLCMLANFEYALTSGPEVLNFFSCSTQLSTKFQLLIKTKLPTNKEVSYEKV